MNRTQILVSALFLASLLSFASAYSITQVNSLLASYNVPANTIKALQPVNLTYAGRQYLVMYNASNPLFVVNLTGAYSMVLNATSIYGIISNYTLTTSFRQINFSALNRQMHLYVNSSASSLNDCLVETGLSSGATCTVANYCASCIFVPLCKCLLIGSGCPTGTKPPGGGVNGIFGRGIIKFENQYIALNASLGQFFGATANVNINNVLQNTAQLSSAFLNISSITRSIFLNPIFPPTANVTPNLIAGCSSYVNQTIAPWYCSALGYCSSINYNYTRLAYISSLLSGIKSLPLSNSQVFQIAYNVSNGESVYAYPILSKQRLAQLNAILNNTIPGYAALVNRTSALLGHISNATLQNDLKAIRGNYNNVTANYFNANFTRANATLALQYAALSNDYAKLNNTYAAVLGYAANNTAKIIALQLYSGTTTKLSDIALAELALNSQISSGAISNVSGINLQLMALAQQLSQFSTSPLTLTEFARSVDAPFIRSLASALGLGYPNAVALAPLLGSLLPLIIGAVVLVALFFFRYYMTLHHKLAVNKRTAENWRVVFVAAVVAVFLYTVATYALLSGASTLAPFSAFQGAYRASPSVVVAVNGTPTLSEYTCASRISAQALLQNKKAVIASISSGLCRVGNSTSTASSCLSFYANSNIPVIMLTNSTHSSIGLYSLYGTILSIWGNGTVMNSCYVSLLTR